MTSPAPDRRFWATILVGFVLAVVAAAGVVAVFGGDGDDERSADRPNDLELVPADPSPGLASTPVLDFDGEELTFDELVGDGTPTVVNFFASWCAPCRIEMPELERLHVELDGEVSFVGLAVQDRVADARRTVTETGVTYPVARDQNGDVLAAMGGTFTMPTTAFLDGDGEVVSLHFGKLTGDEIRSIIDEELR